MADCANGHDAHVVLNVLQPAYGQGTAAPAQGAELRRLMALRDEFARISGNGRFVDAADREWRALPVAWREDLHTLAGLAGPTADLERLARRAWHEIPPPERMRISGVVRGAKRHLSGLVALAAKG